MRNNTYVGITVLFCAAMVLACEPLGGDIDEWQKAAKEKNVPFTVTFEANGGEPAPAPIEYIAKGGKIKEPPEMTNPIHPGYTFDGWYTETDFENRWDFTTDTVSENITLYARWVYTVTFNSNGGTGTTPAAQTANPGSTITLPDGSGLTRDGYAFGGWNTRTNGTGVNYAAGDSYTVSGNVTLYAQWLPSYTVTFSINGGNGTTPNAQTVAAGSSITLPGGSGFYRDGYTFGGWNTSPDGWGTNYDAGSSYTVSGTDTLYARWVYTVTFNINGGTGTTPAVQTANPGSTDSYIILPDGSGFYRDGYTFGGWNTSADGWGTNYDAGSSYTPTGTDTLYARWVYTVTFNINGGTGTTPAVQTVNPGSTDSFITLPDGSGFYRDGYTFIGWNTSADGTGDNYGGGYYVTSTITLYARWVYTVTFDYNNNSGIWPYLETQTVNPGSSITLPEGYDFSIPSADGYIHTYTFMGWNTRADGTGTDYLAGSSYTFSGDITLYAQWAIIFIISYTVVLDPNGGSGTPVTWTVADGASITLPDARGWFYKDGYMIGGWNTNPSGTGTNYLAGSSYTFPGDITLYAQWTHFYTVTFDINGGYGMIPNDQNVADGASITLPYDSGFYRDGGYSFGGWNTNPSGTGTNYLAGSSYTFPGDITLYAQWIFEMMYVPGGSFQMGKELNPSSGFSDETPVHTVTLSGFYMGKYEVTQAQYEAVMGTNPSYFMENNLRPVERVSWYDALVFCNKLSISEGLTPAYRINNSTDPAAWGTVPTSSNSTWDAVTIVSGSTGYRLPTEAQWEYAAKGGNGSPGNYTYAGSNAPDDVAWYYSNSEGSGTHEVGTKAPNGLGLHDMSGNVWEWCWDWYGTYDGDATDPTGASSGSDRIRRGGSFRRSIAQAPSPVEEVRSAYRYYSSPSYQSQAVGFRLVRP